VGRQRKPLAVLTLGFIGVGTIAVLLIVGRALDLCSEQVAALILTTPL
jgi:hypothetical protein